MFEKTLTDLIRGLRSKPQQEFISKCLLEIQTEIKSDDTLLKSEAVAKLGYLHMLGFDMSWAAFHVVELMACNDLQTKRIGYLCATLVFNTENPVLMLTTNLIKKDLSSNVYSESCLALHSLAQIVSHDLARDLTIDIMGLLKHSSPGIRKRSILVLFRIFVQYPESLQQAFPVLKDKLDDPDQSVVLAAINVFAELGVRHPKSYLFLAPTFFNLLKSSGLVWLRIKIAKLFVSFTRIEPRLIKKLISPISEILKNTNALSLLLECIKMVIHGGFILEKDTEQDYSTNDLLDLIIYKLKMLLSVDDVNLNILGLETLKDLLNIRPEKSSLFTESVLRSLDSADLDVRSCALRLIPKMVIHENFMDLVQKLMSYLLPSEDELGSDSTVESDSYRTNVAYCMLEIITKDTYDYVDDFEWIIEITFEISKIPGLDLGHKLSDLLIDINLRVPDVREFTVSEILKFLNINIKELSNLQILESAAFIIGEYPYFVPTSLNCFLILSSEKVFLLPMEVQHVYIQSSFKLFTFWLGNMDIDHDFQAISKQYTDQLQMFSASDYLEVKQRASQFINILREFSERAAKMDSKEEALLFLHTNLRFLFEEELNPTLPNAQDLVLKPSGINLEEWINHEFSLEWNIDDYFSGEEEIDCISEKSDEPIKNKNFQNDAYYISLSNKNTGVDDIPIVNLSINSEEPESSSGFISTKKSKKYAVKKDVDLPAGISLEHALSSTKQNHNEISVETSPNLVPLTSETSQRNTELHKKGKKKRRVKPVDQV